MECNPKKRRAVEGNFVERYEESSHISPLPTSTNVKSVNGGAKVFHAGE